MILRNRAVSAKVGFVAMKHRVSLGVIDFSGSWTSEECGTGTLEAQRKRFGGV
jgi:hypothetical protein